MTKERRAEIAEPTPLQVDAAYRAMIAARPTPADTGERSHIDLDGGHEAFIKRGQD
jgi:hypothetical protein